jgi:hypothetical protein
VISFPCVVGGDQAREFGEVGCHSSFSSSLLGLDMSRFASALEALRRARDEAIERAIRRVDAQQASTLLKT